MFNLIFYWSPESLSLSQKANMVKLDLIFFLKPLKQKPVRILSFLPFLSAYRQ